MKKRILGTALAFVLIMTSLLTIPTIQTGTAAVLNWAWPIQGRGAEPLSNIDYPFGYSVQYGGYHSGIDLSFKHGVVRGTPIIAVDSGTVDVVSDSCTHDYAGNCGCGYGKYVRISHSGGLQSLYGHFSSIKSGIKTGVAVKKGDAIGYAGTTGYSTGIHLHFEVRLNGTAVNPLGADFVYSMFVEKPPATSPPASPPTSPPASGTDNPSATNETPQGTSPPSPPTAPSTSPPEVLPEPPVRFVPTIGDALEIFKQLAGMENKAPEGSTIGDALEILKFLAGMESRFKISS